MYSILYVKPPCFIEGPKIIEIRTQISMKMISRMSLTMKKGYAICWLGLKLPEYLLGALSMDVLFSAGDPPKGSSEPTTLARPVPQTQ